MRKRFFQTSGTTWRRARLSLLGAVALTALTNVTQAQPAFDVSKTIYWLDFSTVPGEVWGTAQGNIGAPYGVAQPNNNGVVNYRYDMTGGVYYGSVMATRLLVNGAQGGGSTSEFDPARSKGAVMLLTKVNTSAVYNNKDTAPYVELPVVKNPKYVVVYGQAEGTAVLKVAVELLDATKPVQPSGAGVSVSGDVVLESEEFTVVETAATLRYGRIIDTIAGSFDSCRVRVRIYGNYNGNTRLFDVYVLGENPVAPTAVALSTDTLQGVGAVYTINAQVEAPEGPKGYYPYADKSIVWSLAAGDEGKATLTGNGLTASLVASVTGVVGVVATTSNGLVATLSIPVETPPAATSVTIVAADPVLPPGDSTILTATVLPAAAAQAVTWTLLPGTDATLVVDPTDNHKAKFYAGNTEVIKKVAVVVDATPTVTDTIDLDVSDVKVTGLAITGPKAIYGIGSTTTLAVTVTPANARVKTVVWASTTPTIATVDPATGVVTSVAVGSTTITATATDGGVAGTNAFAYYSLNVSKIFVDSMNAPNATQQSSLAVAGNLGFVIAPRDQTEAVPLDSLLRYTAAAVTGNRRAQYTMASPVPFTKKAVVEFDWMAGTYNTADATEGQLTIRSGHTTATDHNNLANNDHDIFTFAMLGRDRSSNTGIYTGVGPINAPILATGIVDYNARYMISTTSAIPEAYRVTFSDAPLLSTWYHVKLDFNPTAPEKNVALTLTCLDKDSTGAPKYAEQKVRIPAPASWNPQAVDNLFINCIRTGNITWNGEIDNISVRIADDEADISATGISVAAQFDQIGIGGANLLTATIEPFDATDLTTTWLLEEGGSIATLTFDTTTSRKATLVGTANGTIKVKVTNSTGISNTVTVVIGDVKLNKVTISGDTLVSQNRALTLSTATEPANAGDATLLWSSLDPTIATVSAAGVVSGVLNTSKKEDQVVGIVATAADGGGAADTLLVRVRYTLATRIDVYGRERIFYTDAPVAVPNFTLAPTFLPTDSRTGASKTDDYTWGTIGDANVLSVTNGTVSLAGGYGKAAVTVTSADGSNIVGYYYIEVKHVADNTYDVFSNYETAGDEPSWAGVIAGVTNGANPNNAFQDYHGTRASYSYSNGASGGRTFLTALKNAAVGDRINFRFDWFLTSNTDGVLAIRSDSLGDLNSYGRPDMGSANDDITPVVNTYVAKKNVLALHWDTRVGVDSLFYFTDDYSNAASNDVGASGWPAGTYLNLALNLGGWYTIDLSVDYLLGKITSLTITETDNPTNTVTVHDIPLNEALLADVNKTRTIKAIFVGSERPGSGSNATYSVIDNLGYKATTVTPITLTLDPNGGTFADNNNTATRTFTAAANESIAAYITDVSYAQHTFLGWYIDANTKYESQTFAANVTLTARWEVITYTVTFAGDGVSVPSQAIEYGGKVTQPTEPTRAGYEFDGWYNGGTRWNFVTGTVTADLTLDARWTALAGSVTSVTVAPNPATVQKGAKLQFTATVVVTGSVAQTVTWTVTGGIAGTSISATGELTVAAAETATTLTVTATSTVDATKTGTATVTVGSSGGTAVAAEGYTALTVYPNPTSQLLTVVNDKAKAGDRIEVLSITGALVKAYLSTGPATTIDLSSLAAGTYVVKSGSAVAKIVKQ